MRRQGCGGKEGEPLYVGQRMRGRGACHGETGYAPKGSRRDVTAFEDSAASRRTRKVSTEYLRGVLR